MDDLWGGVPEFPQFRELTLEDKPLFDQLFTRFPPVISEFTFTNLFIWRHAYRPKISRFGNLLCLLSEQGKNSFFFPPIGEGDMIECFQSLLHYLAGKDVHPKIARVPEAVVTQVDWKASGMKAELDRSQCDYVYLVQDMVELKGRKYHRKRNHIKQFKEKYSYEYIPLTPDWVPQCLQLQGEWCDLKNCDADPGLHKESLATKEAFSQFEEIGVKGGAILINGKVEAFTLGDPLNPETIVIHVEKANPAYEGLYPTINQAFLEQEGSGYTYVNREQDLGEEGLRKAKESYFPHHMGNKHTISFE
ncbi:MAG TPA: phosphatidylglycerol lysyltransferase domain-containing protein [Thermodesulfobacteriota bacterium]|nr:phosphatidylglycerol lysyltransferase domain-containing protein [Thermodesulfobacteriota bacterium]